MNEKNSTAPIRRAYKLLNILTIIAAIILWILLFIIYGTTEMHKALTKIPILLMMVMLTIFFFANFYSFLLDIGTLKGEVCIFGKQYIFKQLPTKKNPYIRKNITFTRNQLKERFYLYYPFAFMCFFMVFKGIME